jgi:hypothetical protein
MARRDRSFDYDDPLHEPGRWRRWLLRLGFVAAALVVTYLIATSEPVLRRFVLPYLVGPINGEVHVGSISLSPFSRLSLTDLQIKLADGQTVLAAKQADIRYGLVSYLRGRWIVPQVRLVAPEFHVVRTAEGTTSLDRLLETDTPRRPWVTERPKELLIGRLIVEDGSFSFENQLPGGERTRVAGRELQGALANFGSGREATLEFTGRIGLEKLREGAGGRLILALKSSATTTLGRNLRPSRMTAGIRLETQEATGDYAGLARLTGRFDGALAGKEIRQCRFSFEQNGRSLGVLEVGGPADFQNLNMRLQGSLTNLSHEVLDLAGSPFGLAFGESKLAGSCTVDLSQDGQVLNVDGNLQGSSLAVRNPAGTTPALDLDLTLLGRVNLSSKTAAIRELNVSAREEGRELLKIEALSAINLLWNPTMRSSVTESSVDFRLSRLDLARWRPLFGPALPDGVITVEGVVTNRDDGRRLRAWVTNRVEGLAFRSGPYEISDASVRLFSKIELREFFSISAEEGTLEAQVGGMPLVTGRGTGSYEFGNRKLRLQFDLRAGASNLVARFPHPRVEATEGDLRFDGSVELGQESGVAGVTLVLDGFHGRLDRYNFDGQWIGLDCSVDWNPEQFFVRRFGLSVGATAGEAGTVDVDGRIGQDGEANFRISALDLGPDSLSPFLRPHLGSITLADGRLEIPQATVRITPSGRRDIEAEVQAEGLVIRDEASGVSHFPLTLTNVLALSQSGSRLEFATNILWLPPTRRATNIIRASGVLDLASSEGEPGRISVHSEALDLTPFAEFYRNNRAVPSDVKESDPASSVRYPAGDVKTPRLPEVAVDLDIRRLCVAAMEATNLVVRAVSTNGLLRLDSLTAKIGDGHLRARGQTPWRVGDGATSLQVVAEHLPVDPVSTALFGVERGRYVGDLNAELDYSATAAPATGRFSLTLSNLVCRVMPGWARRTVGPLASAFELDDILRARLSYVGGRARLNGNSISLSDWKAIGDLFVLSLEGEARRGSSWKDTSFELPVGITLRDTLARRLALTDLEPAAQPGFLKLPPLLSIKGTVFDWTPKLDLGVEGVQQAGPGGEAAGEPAAEADTSG